MVQNKGDQQAADTAIPIEKRMDRFELNVRERGCDQRRVGRVLVMNESL